MKLKDYLKKYRFSIVVIVAVIILTIINYDKGKQAIIITGGSFKEMLLVVPPVFILLGLIDVWIPREVMIKHMGEESGIKGILLAFAIGSFAAGPLYGAFPVAGVLMKKGAKFSNVLIFIGAWSTTKIPMLLFEMASLGNSFALSRLVIDIVGIIIIANLLNATIDRKEVEKIYKNAEKF